MTQVPPSDPVDGRTVENWNRRVIPDRVKHRAFTRFSAHGECRISTYSISTHGYAQIGWGESGRTRMVLAHRASWEHENGPVPIGMTLDHLRGVRRCVNPEHLRVLSNFENARRTNNADWPIGFCKNGHTDSGLVRTARRDKRGNRRYGFECPTCTTAYRKKWMETKERDEKRC